MDKKRWETIHQIIDTLLTLPEDQKDDYLKTTCGDDEDLVKEVREYLDHIYESEKSGFLSDMAGENSDLFNDLSRQQKKTKTDSTHSLVGKKVGNYQISKLIDEGGMGQVYLGERVDGEFEQKVAIKFLNQRSVSKDIRLRFSQEKKILGNLKHPNIALLLDGGVLDNGSPYLIMEYIDGTPIDEYCNENKLNVNERLILFKEVLKAIDFAHSNLVVHRDLKPSNILINKNGRVKILDFGIAKLMQDDSTVDIKLTKQGQRLWTPQFAAPEQILEKPPLIQTDIYALGTLLHLLLTNDTPFDLSDKSLHEVEKVILNETPKSLTTSLSEASEKEIQSHFSVSKNSLMKILKRDLEAIVSKALRKPVSERYSSIDTFMEDIWRFEDNLPVLAAKGNFRYKALKFSKRNSTAIISTFFILSLLTIITLIYTNQLKAERDEALYQANRAETVSKIMTGILSNVQPNKTNGQELSAIGLLDQGVLSADTVSQPEVKADILFTIGEAYYGLGDHENALKTLQMSYDVGFAYHQYNSHKPAFALSTMGEIYGDRYENELALEKLNKAIEHFERAPGDHLYNISTAKNRIASIDFLSGNFNEALKSFKEVYNFQVQLYDSNSIQVAGTLNSMGGAYNSLGMYNEAIKIIDKLIKIYTLNYGENNSRTVEQYSNKAITNYSLGNIELAKEISTRVLEKKKNIYKQAHPSLAVEYHSLGRILIGNEEYSKADSLLGISIGIYKEVFGPEHVRISLATHLQAKAKGELGYFQEADSLFSQSISSLPKYFPQSSTYITVNVKEYGQFLADYEKYDRALNIMLDQLANLNGNQRENRETGLLLLEVGRVYMSINEFEKAEKFIIDSAELLKEYEISNLKEYQQSVELLTQIRNELN